MTDSILDFRIIREYLLAGGSDRDKTRSDGQMRGSTKASSEASLS